MEIFEIIGIIVGVVFLCLTIHSINKTNDYFLKYNKEMDGLYDDCSRMIDKIQKQSRQISEMMGKYIDNKQKEEERLAISLYN